jgi:hypothetical protein
MVQRQRVAALMLSSLFFLAPVVYVFFVVSPWHHTAAVMATITSIVSAATWNDRSNALLANVDRVTARTSGAAFTALGLYNIPLETLYAVGFPLWLAMVALYAASVRYNRNVFHFLFHVAIATGMLLITHHLPTGGDAFV